MVMQVYSPAYLVPSQDKLGGLCGKGIRNKIGGKWRWGYRWSGWGGDRGVQPDCQRTCLYYFPTPHKIQNDDRLPQHVSDVSESISLLVRPTRVVPDKGP